MEQKDYDRFNEFVLNQIKKKFARFVFDLCLESVDYMKSETSDLPEIKPAEIKSIEFKKAETKTTEFKKAETKPKKKKNVIRRSKLDPYRDSIIEMMNAGVLQKDIAKKLGFDRETLRRWLIKNYHNGKRQPLKSAILAKNKAKIIKWINNGKPQSEIAKKFEISGAYLNTWIKKNGIEIRK